MIKGYDPACYHLAMDFVADSNIPVADQPRLADELAQLIQSQIELFLNYHEPKEEE